MSNLTEHKSKSDDLSTYIKRQLSTILKQVQQTPPKKSQSLKKIQHIVQKSNIPNQSKQSIQKQIKRVQSAMDRSRSVHQIKLKLKNQPKTPNKYQKKLFYENMILEEKQLNQRNKFSENKFSENKLSASKNKPTPNKIVPKDFLNLVDTFQDLRTQRLKYEHQILSLSIKAQKLQRLIQLKRQNENKYLQSTIISKKYHEKKETLEFIRSEVKNAAQQNRKKIVSVLMKKYSQVQQS